jgi:hypothetical protein
MKSPTLWDITPCSPLTARNISPRSSGSKISQARNQLEETTCFMLVSCYDYTAIDPRIQNPALLSSISLQTTNNEFALSTFRLARAHRSKNQCGVNIYDTTSQCTRQEVASIFRVENETDKKTGRSIRQTKSFAGCLMLVSCLAYSSTLKM